MVPTPLVTPTRPTVAHISLGAIASNVKGIRKQVGKGVAIMAVVKANAYGHGMVEVARYLERHDVECFGVAFPEEGVELRNAGIQKPIQVFTLPTEGQTGLYLEHHLEPTVCTQVHLKQFHKAARKMGREIAAHLKIDTGMNRIGVRPEELEDLLLAWSKTDRVELKGVYTHFATSDERDKSYARHQISRFHQALDKIRAGGFDPRQIHAANSAAILDLPESYFNLVRPGIMTYGYYPSRTTSERIPLTPALTLHTRVAQVKRIEHGDTVSYGRRFVAPRRTTIATLPLGYADGFSRLLTGKATVLIQGHRLPVVGTICMDQCMVDCGDVTIKPGDEAVIIGGQGSSTISAWDLADRLSTIPYEVCCGITARVPRTYTTS